MDTKEYLQEAKSMLSSNILDQKKYDEIENYVIKHFSKRSNDADLQSLIDVMMELAQKFGKKDIIAIQEHFGLNSCAQ